LPVAPAGRRIMLVFERLNQDGLVSDGHGAFRIFFCAMRNAIPEDERVSAFRNFLMSASAESFSFFVFDTVQSEGTNKLKLRIWASFAVKRTQKFPAMPVRIKVCASKYRRSVSSVVEKNPECFSLSTK
jgi:hypothetical protein